MCTLVLLVDQVSQQKGEELIRAYGSVLSRFRYRNLRPLFLCHRLNSGWFGRLLGACPDLSPDEAELRVRGCENEGVATAVLLLGAKKQLVLFPNKFEAVRGLCERGGGRVGRGGAWSEREGGLSGGESLRQRDVGEVLGNTLGYESSDDDEEEREGGSTESEGEGAGPGRSSRSHHAPYSNSTHTAHSDGERYLELVRQVQEGFQHWCERLADGSLRRYRVQAWPEWTQPSDS